MSLILETGAGVLNAEAYADASAYVTWYTNFYGSAPSGTTTLQEAAIRRAVRYMEALPWKGLQSFGRQLQGLAWPRAWVEDKSGWTITANTIPVEVIEAQHMLTTYELASPGGLSPAITIAAQKILTQLDVLSWTPAGGGNTVSANRPVVTLAMDRLYGLILPGNRMVRA
jgi:hypothetical protein